MDNGTAEEVRRRAANLCEYCRMPQAFYRQRFQIDHIIARQHGGSSNTENLALSCMHCNRHKGPNLAGFYTETGTVISLFNPRRDRWADHFRWDGAMVAGLTPTGTVTVLVLAMNHPDLIAVREELIREGVFPPPQ